MVKTWENVYPKWTILTHQNSKFILSFGVKCSITLQLTVEAGLTIEFVCYFTFTGVATLTSCPTAETMVTIELHYAKRSLMS